MEQGKVSEGGPGLDREGIPAVVLPAVPDMAKVAVVARAAIARPIRPTNSKEI